MTEQAKTYIGTKMVKAKPMSRSDYNAFRGWNVPENENPNDAGYLVEYTDSDVQPELSGKADGYVSWSPKAVFERSYQLLSNNEPMYYFAKTDSDNGNVYIGESETVDEARKAAEAIEQSATIPDEFDFGLALHLLKAGERVARTGWNGKGMYLFLVNGEGITNTINDNYGNPDKESDIALPVKDAIYLKTTDNELVPWVASQTDVLADDWLLAIG